ncbi:hypothetical protein [Amycolatopsis sp. FDAARGOS 1241]|uniref:hypothetical protein n=1 Tax=Amycolatopsis sp. FDAARGOS 1241 TaxID=2778070 RepID=UPI001951B107|nr:hypothetical protein [Amycolatopsis sp. FDAARGOS 1241]QRP45567.1 hypothetical protein I6J71_41690 [Amycolatopsis sp. FDAARGOS 1241]
MDNTLTSVTGVVDTVGDVGGEVLPPVATMPGTGEDPPLIPIGDVLGPVFSGGSVSGGVSATVPEQAVAPVPELAGAPVTATEAVPATMPKQEISGVRYLSAVHMIPVQRHAAAAKHDNASHVGATNGGDGAGGGGGLPSAPSAPAAPSTTVNPGHDGPGGARQPFAVAADSVTTTQLKLIGVSRDHEVAGAGREAALPTTSPD